MSKLVGFSSALKDLLALLSAHIGKINELKEEKSQIKDLHFNLRY
jgi:hypothetical protein